MADDELVQMAERALADAEAAYRSDPSEANQRQVLSAWSFVQKARGGPPGERTTPDDRVPRKPAEGELRAAPNAVLALVDAVLVDLAVRSAMYVGRRREDADDETFVIQTGEEGRARLRLPHLDSDESIERMIWRRSIARDGLSSTGTERQRRSWSSRSATCASSLELAYAQSRSSL